MLQSGNLSLFPSSYRRPRWRPQKNIFPTEACLKQLKEKHIKQILKSRSRQLDNRMVDASIESNPPVFEEDKSTGVNKIVKSHKNRNKIQVKENIVKSKQMLWSKKKVANKGKERNRILKRNIRFLGSRKQESDKG
ncbi:unnamed protein product [Hermetia illucens]|uniref:Uncharacterized protein n=1 Tax=Hermetia illucens TaxID=343691 RepID=A0A7R8UDA4_HERIL|nr:unnamed protein product [Hermetia illucens]